MKIACTSDWHVHNFTDFSRTMTVVWDSVTMRYIEVDPQQDDYELTREMNSRLYYILQGLCDMRDYCMDNNIEYILLAGDIFHHRGSIDVTVFAALQQVLTTFKVHHLKIIAIAGNHDQVDNSRNPVSALNMFRDVMTIIQFPELVRIWSHNPIEIVAVPYSRDKKYVLNSMKELHAKCENPDQAILMCHLGVDGGTVGSGMYVMSDEYTLGELKYDTYKYVVIGHYHQPQLLAYNSFYCGTPVQNNFGDELPGDDGYNGFFVIDMDKRFDIQFIPITGVPRFRTFTSSEELKALPPEYLRDNYIRVKADAQEAELIQDLLDEDDAVSSVRVELEKDYSVDHRSDVGVTQTVEETVITYAAERWEYENTLKDVIQEGLTILESAYTGGN